MDDSAWLTLTHARVRAKQGDRRGARQILVRILERAPGNAEAAGLLRSLNGLADRPDRSEAPDPVEQRLAAEPRSLTPRFRSALAPASRRAARRRRIERLEAWLRDFETS